MSALLPIILVALHTGSVASRVPDFNIAPTCRVDLTSRGACRRDEQAAKQTLQRRWRRFSLAERKSCVDLSQLGGEPSYVELLTCLDMAKQARALPAADRLKDLMR